ncbi:MAG TPA: HlyD family secretion protein [Opitutaceae bacterium]|nr:HlyD family secretion protein [Opitutaceae bacterium]
MSTQTSSSASPTRAGNGRGKIVLLLLAAAVVAAGGLFGFHRLRFALSHEETDDAEVDGDISPVLPRVNGYVAQIFVKENQRVEAGQPLLAIDPKELDLKVAAAEAAVQSADSTVHSAEAALANARAAEAVARANVVTARVTRDKAAADLARDSRLFQTNAISASQLSDTRAASDEAAARFTALQRQAEAAAAQIVAAQAQLQAARDGVTQRRSDLDYARLQRSYATVTAPIAGVISRKEVELGQFVQVGQTLMSVASDRDVWLVANYKETQIARIRPGQPVEFTVDGYRSTPFHGRVESLSGATGARFALLPPDNASGNFVKVTQRIPVRIAVASSDAAPVLRPGMSVDVAVDIRN